MSVLVIGLGVAFAADLSCGDTEWPGRCRRALRSAGRLSAAGESSFVAGLTPARPPSEAAATEGAPLVVATWNLGLVRFFGDYQVPFAAERRAALPDALGALFVDERADIVLLQEGYEAEDRALITEIAASYGWTHVDADALGPNRSGLHLLVAPRLAVIASGATRLPRDPFAIAGWPRCLLWAELTDGERALRVGNVHLTPLPRRRLSWHRTRQFLALHDALSPGGPLDAPARLLGGDLNASPAWAWPGPVGRERVLAWDARLIGTLAHQAPPPNDTPLWTLYRANAVHTVDAFGGHEPDRQVDHLFGWGLSPIAAHTALTGPVPGAPAPSDHYALVTHFVWDPPPRSP